jgi:hypothetical protein
VTDITWSESTTQALASICSFDQRSAGSSQLDLLPARRRRDLANCVEHAWEADALFAAARDAGINLFDTANLYAQGRSEEILGQSFRNLGMARGDIVIATKAASSMRARPCWMTMIWRSLMRSADCQRNILAGCGTRRATGHLRDRLRMPAAEGWQGRKSTAGPTRRCSQTVS